MENTKLREALERVFFAAEDEVSTHGILGSDCKCPLCIAVAEYRAALREATPAATEGGEKLDMHKINRCPHCNHYHSSAQGCVPCPDCGGTGDGKWNEPAICTACNGTGKVDPASPSLPAKEERPWEAKCSRCGLNMGDGIHCPGTTQYHSFTYQVPAPQPAATGQDVYIRADVLRERCKTQRALDVVRMLYDPAKRVYNLPRHAFKPYQSQAISELDVALAACRALLGGEK